MERRRAALVLGLAILLAACATSPGPTAGPTTAAPAPSASASAASTPLPSAAPTASADPAAVYAEIEAQVQQIRALKAKTPVDPKLLDEAALQKNVADSFARDNPPKLVAANQRLLELMGLLPAGSNLADLYVKLLGSQVAGYYDPDTKELYVVSKSGAVGPTEKTTFAHEFTHALQDQNFGLKNLKVDEIGEGDASLARLSLAEGDATVLMSQWATAHLTPGELARLIAEGNDPEQQKILAEMPEILKQTLLFPYTSGFQMVLGRQAAGGWAAVDAMYAKPPASTEQVLHPEKYAAREAPIEVTFPKDLAKRLGTGWSVDLQDTLGEFQLRIWLEQAGGLPGDAAIAAAGGWGGDRVALVRKGSSAGIVLDTRWDSAGDAAEFAAAAQKTLDKLGGHRAMIAIDGTDRVTLFIATDDATINALGSALGLAG